MDWVNKSWLPWRRPLSDHNPISQQSSTPIRLPILKTGRRAVAYILWKLDSKAQRSKKQEAVSAVSHSNSVKMVPFDRSHTTSYSTSIATIWLSHAVSGIQHDKILCGYSQPKWLLQIVYLQPKFYHPCKFSEDWSGRCWDNRSVRNRFPLHSEVSDTDVDASLLMWQWGVLEWGVQHCMCIVVPQSVGTYEIWYDTRCYFNVQSKADISQLNLPQGTSN